MQPATTFNSSTEVKDFVTFLRLGTIQRVPHSEQGQATLRLFDLIIEDALKHKRSSPNVESSQLDQFVTLLRADTAETFKIHGEIGLASIRITNHLIDGALRGIKVSEIKTIDAKDFLLLTNLMPTMSETLKMTLLHIAGMPECLHDPTLHGRLLDWALNNQAPERVKMFFDLLREINSQPSPTVEKSAKPTEQILKLKDEKKVEAQRCQIAIGDNQLPMQCCTMESYARFNCGTLVCHSHFEEVRAKNPKDSEGFSTVTLTTPVRRYASQTTVAGKIFFSAQALCCQVQLDGVTCTNVAKTSHTYGGLICEGHAKELDTNPKTRYSIPVNARPVPYEKPAEINICQIAIGNNLLSMQRCAEKFIGKMDSGVSVCNTHCKEIVAKNPKSRNGVCEITTKTPVRLYSDKMATDCLVAMDGKKVGCQVQLSDVSCINQAVCWNSYGALLCHDHSSELRYNENHTMTISGDAAVVTWPLVLPKTSPMKEEIKHCEIAVGDNLLAMQCCPTIATCKMGCGLVVCREHHCEIVKKNPDTRGVYEITPTTPVRAYAATDSFSELKAEEPGQYCQVRLEGVGCEQRSTHRNIYGGLLCKGHVIEMQTNKPHRLTIPTNAPVKSVITVGMTAVNLGDKTGGAKPTPRGCEMAVGDNMLKLAQCTNSGARNMKGKGDEFEICAEHASEIRQKNGFSGDSNHYPITTLTPVKCFNSKLALTPLDTDRDICCQVVSSDKTSNIGSGCKERATHETIYGNFLCNQHVKHLEHVQSGGFDDISIPRRASKMGWVKPKTDSPATSDDDSTEAIGPNVKSAKVTTLDAATKCSFVNQKTGVCCSMIARVFSNGSGFCPTHAISHGM